MPTKEIAGSAKPQHPKLDGLYFISFEPMGRAKYRGEAEWDDIMRSGWKFYPDRDSWESASQELTEESEES